MIASVVATVGVTQEAYDFSSPSFSGVGFSNHVLMLEQIGQANQQRIDDQAAVDAAAALRDLDNSNLNKFLRNVESRIYAQISKQLVDAIFGDDPAATGTIVVGGTTVSYVNDGSEITLTLTDGDGNVTTVTVPVGDFGI